jgi:hypothetical protein
MSIETHVVVLADEVYTGGVGYRGPVLKELGFPEGPYILGVAKIFVNQAKRSKTKADFKIVEYIPE